MKKSTRVLAVLLAVGFGCLAVFGGLMAAGLLPGQLSESVIRSLDRIRNNGSSDDDPTAALSNAAVRTPPAGLRGVYLDLNADLKTAPTDTYGALSGETTELFSAFRNVRANALFLTPELAGRFASFHDAYGTAVDLVWQIISHADEGGYYKVLAANDAMMFTSTGELTDGAIASYLLKYTFDAVLLDGDALRARGCLSTAVSFLGERLRQAFPDRALGLLFTSGAAPAFTDDELNKALQCPYLRFCVVDAGGAMRSAQAFGSVMTWWNTLAGGFPQISFFCRHRLDLVGSNASDWGNYTEICDQVRYLWDLEQFEGSLFYGTNALRSINSASIQRLAYLIYDGETKGLKLTGLTLAENGEGATFTGKSPTGRKLLCNRQVLLPTGGDFSFGLLLSEGENSFRFFSGGADQRYRIFRNSASAAAYRNASVTARVTPYTDHGLGTALMCRIAEPYAETLGTPTEKDTYHADSCTLTQDTLDYVKSVSVSTEGHLRYELGSGIAVYAENCELLSGVYRMPANRISVAGVDDTATDRTTVVLDSDWQTPISVKCLPQTYTSGYQGYRYTVSDFTAAYVDVRFYYTEAFSGEALLRFSATSPFSSAQLFSDGASIVLRLNLRRAGQFYGFTADRDEAGRLVLSFKKHTDGSLTGKTVMLDAGHGGSAMTGTALRDGSVAEKDITLSIAKKAKQMLESLGATVLMTRTLDTSVSLQERCDLQLAADPDIFVSIHCDGTDDLSESGTHTFYFRPYSMPLASAIHNSLVSYYRTYIYKPTDTNYAKIDRGIKYYPFYVNRLDGCPSVLVETGFLTNAVEGPVLANDNYQYWMAQGIADGVRNYFLLNH